MSTISKITVNGIKSKSYNVMIERYASANEVVKDCESRERTDAQFHDMKTRSYSSFQGVASYDEALELMKNGYQPTVDALKSKISNGNMGNGKRISFKNNVAGFSPVVPLALMGIPNNMIDIKMKPIKCKVIDVYYDMVFSCGIDSQDIINNGQKILGAITELEKEGYRFNLYAVQTYADNIDCDMLCVKVKSSNQPIDLKRMSFPLTHTSFLRVIGFDWYSKTPNGRYRCGYGHNIAYELYYDESKLEKFATTLFGNNAVYFAGAKILTKSEEHIKEVMINAGNRKLGKM